MVESADAGVFPHKLVAKIGVFVSLIAITLWAAAGDGEWSTAFTIMWCAGMVAFLPLHSRLNCGIRGLFDRTSAPCITFEGWLGQPGWLKRFFEARRPGAYLPVIDKGRIRAGDDIEVVFRPQHDVTVALAFRAFTTERELLPQLAVAEALPDEAKALLRNRTRQDG